MNTLRSRVEAVRERIARAAGKAGRLPSEVTLVAVSKTRPATDIAAVAALGLRHFGENRVQEAATKLPQFEGDATFHLIGHLQSNKARVAARLFQVIQSVDSLRLAERLNRIAAEVGEESLPVFVQADLAGEKAKFGVPEPELPRTLERTAEMESLRVRGLMILPPAGPEPEAARPWFVRLRELAERFAAAGLLPNPPELSMGMSHDFEVAIEEGATTVRVGTAIFGPRQSPPAN